MFSIKAPDIPKLKAEYEKRQHIKNKYAIEAMAKEKKKKERLQLEREQLEKKAAAKLKVQAAKGKKSAVPATSIGDSLLPKLSSNFKIPKKVASIKGHPSGTAKRQAPKKEPQVKKCPATSASSFVAQTEKNPELASTLFEVQNWLMNGRDAGRKTNVPRPIVMNEDSKNSFNLDEEEPMIIDMDEVVGSIQRVREASIYDDERVCGQLTNLSRAMSIGSEHTYGEQKTGNAKNISLVLDTNVLAGDLALVDDIRRSWSGENGSVKIVLVVPWVVLQELDKLKDDKQDKKPALKTLAAGAVRYLHDLLKNGDLQIRGQTIQETSEDVGWEITCNDDRILQCCFQCKKRDGGDVILFSNDRNLCNKAMVNQLQACSKETIVQFIERLAPLPAHRKKMLEVTNDGKVEPGSKLCSEILTQAKKILHDILELVLKVEMFNAFGEMWTSVVIIKPPWRLQDILKCLKKHWIAVFGQILPKKAKEPLEIICAKFTLMHGAIGKDDLKALLVASLRFLAYFENTGATYSERITPSIHEIRNLLDVVKNIRLANYQAKAGDGTQHTAHMEARARRDATPDDFVVPVGIPEILPHPYLHLRNTLHKIWNFVNNMCGLLYNSLGLQSPPEYQHRDKISSTHAISQIPRFYSAITNLRQLLETVLLLGEHANPENEAFANLAAFLDNFLNVMGLNYDPQLEEVITPMALHQFCTMSESRERFIAGFYQLENVCNLMYRCILEVKGRGSFLLDPEIIPDSQ